MDSTEAEEQLQAMDAAWQGPAGASDSEEEEEAREASGQGKQHSGAAVAAQQHQAAAASGAGAGGESGSRRGGNELTNLDPEVQGRGAVNIGEAAEAVETGHAHGSSSSDDDGGSDVTSQRKAPIVVDADRTSFERLLLMPGRWGERGAGRHVFAVLWAGLQAAVVRRHLALL